MRAPHRVQETVKAVGRPSASSDDHAIALPPQNGQPLRVGIFAPRLGRLYDPLTTREEERDESVQFELSTLHPPYVDDSALRFDVGNAIFIEVVAQVERLVRRARR